MIGLSYSCVCCLCFVLFSCLCDLYMLVVKGGLLTCGSCYLCLVGVVYVLVYVICISMILCAPKCACDALI